jgi:predicted peptidase
MPIRIFICLVVMIPALSMCRKKADIPVSVSVPVITNSHILVADTQRINAAFGGYYIGLPSDYLTTFTTYPVLIFLHGLGQRGNGKEQLKYLLSDGIGKVIKENRMPISFNVNGESFSLIVVSPQYDQQPDVQEVMQLIDTIEAKYRVKRNRIYISGLSLGARIATLVAAEFPMKFAAMVPIAGVATNEGMNARCKSIAEANLPVWELHNADDPMADVEDARRFIKYLSDYTPAIPPRFTVFDKYGHDAWTTALDTAYREDGRNIYEWMLQYYR